MNTDALMTLSYTEIKEVFAHYLQSQTIDENTKQTMRSSAFLIWRKMGKDHFWNVVLSDNFDYNARSTLTKLSAHKSKKEQIITVSNYMYHLSRFRQFVVDDHPKPSMIPSIKSKKKEEPSSVIILNKMYSGSYLKEGENIGHEIINLYTADNGNHYLYLNPSGTISMEYDSKHLVILLVRKFAKHTYKVLAKAEGISILPFANVKMSRTERHHGLLELNLSYGGVSLVDLFGNNTYQGSMIEEKDSWVTFEAKHVITPINQLLITDHAEYRDENCFYIRTKHGFGSQNLREYYDEIAKPDSYLDLSDIVNNADLWHSFDTTQKVSEFAHYNPDSHFNFLKIIKQEDNEVIISNILAYLFDAHRDLFIQFASKVLKVELTHDFIIERETKNIDLCIKDASNIVVIENKIKSGINGITDKHNIYGDTVQSQLHKYYEYAVLEAKPDNKMIHCFIFSPNYTKIDLSRFTSGNHYTVVYYRDIYEFYNTNKHQLKHVAYYQDFVNVLYKHSKDYDNDLEEEMQRRFQKAIASAK